MSLVTHIVSVMVPVADQDTGIAFYRDTLAFDVSADVPFGEGERWVEVTPPGGGTAIALVLTRDHYEAGRMTGIGLATTDARAAHAELKAKGVDVDAELMGGDGTVPLLFFFRDPDGNTLLVVEAP